MADLGLIPNIPLGPHTALNIELREVPKFSQVWLKTKQGLSLGSFQGEFEIILVPKIIYKTNFCYHFSFYKQIDLI